MLMSGVANPRLRIGPLIRVKASVSSVTFNSRKRSLRVVVGAPDGVEPVSLPCARERRQRPQRVGSAGRERLSIEVPFGRRMWRIQAGEGEIGIGLRGYGHKTSSAVWLTASMPDVAQ